MSGSTRAGGRGRGSGAGSGAGGSGGNHQRKGNNKSNRRTHHSTTFHSKEHFLATNYRYVVPSYANFMQTGFFDPDVMVDWDDIQLVIATLDKDSAAESCAICLEEFIVLPQLTKCGHLFCLTCLLRYLEAAYTKKCPVCSRCDICRPDLRDVLFVTTPPPVVKSTAIFSLLSKEKSSLFPICYDSSSESLLSCPDLQTMLVNKKGEKAKFDDANSSEAEAVGIPEIDSHASQYSRLCYASPQKLIRFVNQSLKTLENFRKQCLASGSTAHPSESRGDVEYLNFIPEASILLTSRRDQIKSHSMKHGIPSIGSTAPLPTVTTTSVSSSAAVWLYQQQAGHMSFLHPLCMRALLYQQSQDLEQIRIEIDDSLKSDDAPMKDHSSQEHVCGLPAQVSGAVFDVEVCTVTPEQRKRYPFIRHLPLDCEFSLVEIDMKSSLSSAVYDHFRSQFKQRDTDRKLKRNKQLKEEKKDKQRLQSQQDRLVAGRRELHQHYENEKSNAIQSLLSSPPVGGVNSLLPEADEERNQSDDVNAATNSFARITELGVSNNEAFPTLGGGVSVTGVASKSISGSKVPVATPTWGSNVSASGVSRGGLGTAEILSNQKKKGKNKFSSHSSLFATSSTRSYK
jgi:hypothetical protein